jgi:hypothetical protein
MKYYVVDTEELAIGAENYISSIAGAPIVGVNAKTGLPALNKCKTIRWAIPQERLDGKWVFPYVKEEYNKNWFPIIEEDV